MTRISLLGYRLVYGALGDVIEEIMTRVASGERRNCAWLACLNPHSYAVAKKDRKFQSALKSADWLIPDGVGVVLAARVLGCPIRRRIAGFDIFKAVMQALDAENGTVYFLGSTVIVLDAIKERLLAEYPNVRVLGAVSPPFRLEFSDAQTASMINGINEQRPDVLWVGMTAPKQEKWLAANADRLEVGFAAAVGAVFDFYAGTVRRSPVIFQNLGLEWLPRLIKEPRRLWRRMFVSAPLFMWDVAKVRVNRRGIR